MNVYDTANKLATEIKECEEYKEFKKIKEEVNKNPDLKNKIEEFEQARYKIQMDMMQKGKMDEEEYKNVENMYGELFEKEEVQKFFQAETKFNVMLADVNKIIGEAIREIIK